MKLFYRSTSYEYDSDRQRLGNTGRPGRPAHLSRSPYTLIYRGETYQIDPNIPALPQELPQNYELIYRGTVYRVSRDAQGVVGIVDQSASKKQVKTVSIPSVLPRHYLAKVHQASMMKNLQHRLQVAEDQDNQTLIKMLEAEMRQIAA
jgi:hypothetical protein